MLGNSVLFTIAFLILSAACNVWMLYFGRFLSGMASGITTIATPTYVAEIASSNIRGMLGSSFQVRFFKKKFMLYLFGNLLSDNYGPNCLE